MTITDATMNDILAPLVPGGVQWFPGHMAKAKREVSEKLKLVNAVVEVVDARIPASSRHPGIGELIGNRTHVIALTKTDLADPSTTREWVRLISRPDRPALPVDASRGTGIRECIAALRRTRSAGIRALVLGVPNSGKSSLINRACGRAGARVGATAGVTRGQQWLRAADDVEFLDTPGLLWPKISNLLQSLKLAWLGSVGENAYDPQVVGGALAVWLAHLHPEVLAERYGIDDAPMPIEPEAWLDAIGQRRGCLVAGGAINREQAARILLQDLRIGRLGRLTLDTPPGGANT